MKKQRLELTWIGKDDRPRLEPRILIEDQALSHHAAERVTDEDLFDNRLVFGDNLLALKALEQEFTEQIKCIYIDPPYNTGQAMEHYDDGLEHSIWLSLMRERLEVLRELLAKDGVFLCQLNDDEMAYAKVMLDEVFGRSNFLNHVSVRMKQTAGASGGGEDKRLKKNTEHLLIYAKDRDGEGGFQKFNDVYDEEDLFDVIEQMKDEGKSWKYTRVLLSLGEREFFKTVVDGSGNDIDIYVHRGVVMKPITALAAEEGITEEQCYKKYFDKVFRDTNAQSSIRTRVMEVAAGRGEFFSIEYTPRSGRRKGQKVTLYYKGANCDLIAWLSDVAVKRGDRLLKLEKTGTYWEGFPLNNLTKEGGVQFPKGKKPEALLQKVLELCTNPGDWVLDSFAGSGTTGAVAQKMGRRWIMIELGEHCHTHIIPRMKRVIAGEDTAGITRATQWKGGGGFRYYKLASSLLEKDKWGNWVIQSDYNPAMLAEAVCKLMGFSYAPSEQSYWMHGYSSERDFIYVTTQSLTRDQLLALSEEVGDDRSLLVCCKAFNAKPDAFLNLTIKKIPLAVLRKCEWGKDDYSLTIQNLPEAKAEPIAVQSTNLPKRRASKAQADLFAEKE
ncbi:site-specific DNA-methyltransferase [Cupriavidus plantarum]|uniref:site-specific DNA-methyltransferase (adenine-specific) n=1 Tax=Cupriavidus plantarum TaxID=942865 RepID=A0A316EJ85_9BURK|nr:site-specific DNA-methyltransferase [Cupriavidus plantarum]PWK32325.1 adenine-specific DNA-methyltransferase [Cupriavidus plantarum]